MGFLSSSLLAFGMSADAFAVSLGKGATIEKPMFRDALRIGAIFGAVEATAPVFGWLVGLAASGFIRDIDHWLAFAILCFVGLKYIHESFQDKKSSSAPKTYSIWILLLTALATSVDAFAVGISLAFVNYDIFIAALSIGTATFVMVTLGIMTGHLIGHKVGVYAERLGGLLLILIGLSILLSHLSAT